MDFSVVIPVFNEGDYVRLLAEEIIRLIKPEHNFEIIFVDDHSTDQTPELLHELSLSSKSLRFIRHVKQYGQSGALKTGVLAATYPLIVTLDGDGQNDPKDIATFITCFESNDRCTDNLLVNGHRQDRNDTGWRRLSSRIANQIRRILLNDSTPDSGCGIKAFHQKLFLELPSFNHMHRFLPALVLQQGGQITNLPVGHRERTHGQSKYGTFDRLSAGIIDLLGVMWLARRNIKTEIEKRK